MEVIKKLNSIWVAVKNEENPKKNIPPDNQCSSGIDNFLTLDEIKKVKKLVQGYVMPKEYDDGSLRFLASKVCNFYCINMNEFLSKRRQKYLVNARIDFIHMAKKETQRNYAEIARFLQKHHTTILHHVKKQPVNLDKIIDE
jgi:chromosomal replication initiation ATPase DnaA